MSFCHFVIVIFVADACATLFQRLWPVLPIQPSRFHREIILMSELRGVLSRFRAARSSSENAGGIGHLGNEDSRAEAVLDVVLLEALPHGSVGAEQRPVVGYLHPSSPDVFCIECCTDAEYQQVATTRPHRTTIPPTSLSSAPTIIASSTRTILCLTARSSSLNFLMVNC